jgi:thiol:disulfide interchange protein DsbC
MKQLLRSPSLLGLILWSASSAALAADANIAHIRNSLSVFLPNLKLDQIKPSVIPGLYQVTFDTRVLYVSEDGRYVVTGSVFDLEHQQDLTKPVLEKLRTKLIDGIGEDNMLIYEPEQRRYQVTVFTDVDCPYCRKMHSQMPGYLAEGIRFRYLLFPRAGKNSPSYDKAVSVWCAKDRHAAMARATEGKEMPKRSCPNPVDQHLDAAGKLAVRGTPAIVLDSGEVIPGYLPPKRLLQVLKQRSAK